MGSRQRTWERYSSSEIHRLLLKVTEPQRERLDPTVAQDGWVPAQALFCPYYCTLEGCLGADWGVVVNPRSVKFGQLVFEHDWCGCPGEVPDDPSWCGEFRPFHGCGDQAVDEWFDLTREQVRTAICYSGHGCLKLEHGEPIHPCTCGPRDDDPQDPDPDCPDHGHLARPEAPQPRVLPETATVDRYRLSMLTEADCVDYWVWDIYVEHRGNDQWAVTRGGNPVLSADGGWDMEAARFIDDPDERETWLTAHRFDLANALALAEAELPRVHGDTENEERSDG